MDAGHERLGSAGLSPREFGRVTRKVTTNLAISVLFLCCSPTRRAPSRARGMGRGPIESLPQSFRKLEIVAENRAWSTAVTLRSFPFVPKHQQHIFHFCRISI